MIATSSSFDPASLTDAEAIRALHLLYELSPAAAWEGGRKPSPERLKTLAEGLAEEAPNDLKTAVATLLDGNNPGGSSGRAALARILLKQAAESPEFASSAAQAMTTAVKPEMFLDPITAGLIVALVVGMSHINTGSFRYDTALPDVIKELHLPELLDKLPAIIKALPAGIWEAAFGPH
jgi:hypothetical protein